MALVLSSIARRRGIRRDRHGFSLIEALVVLAISGMALAIIFTIGVKAGDTGFGLGRRAMAAADSDVAISDVRTIVRSLGLRPLATFVGGADAPLAGQPNRLEGEAVMERATQCAPQGWSGHLVLEITRRDNGGVLTCTAAGKTVTLLDIARGTPTLSYSGDGQLWSPTYSNQPDAQSQFGEARALSLWVRFSAAPEADIVELVQSGRPEAWRRFDGGF